MRCASGATGPFALKPSQLVEAGDELIIEGGPRYVSRGGIKLQNALDELGIEVTGRGCLDVGASTGGFSDCLLQRGAERVAAVDVGYGQLAASLRDDPRVTVLERVNARELRPQDLPFRPDFAVIDVSFISLRKVLPAVASCLTEDAGMLAMVKPQFEVGRAKARGGVVRSPEDRREAILSVAALRRRISAFECSASPHRVFPARRATARRSSTAPRHGDALADLEAAVAEVEP